MSAVWNAGACSRFSRICQGAHTFVLKAYSGCQKRRRAAALQNVGAPTKSNCSSSFMPLPGGTRLSALPNKIGGLNPPIRNFGNQVAS